MTDAPILVDVFRNQHPESCHRGHAVVLGPDGQIEAAWGDPERIIFPRSSCKMVQALPLVESGAADAAGLGEDHLALACASHQGAPIHTDLVRRWLDHLGVGDADLCCGPQTPRDAETRNELIRADRAPCRIHNNCSGKHAGFLTLAQHLGAKDARYVDPAHPVQQAVLAATEETAEEHSSGFGIDGCSAPNHRLSLLGFARALSGFATAATRNDVRSRAQVRLVDAMRRHPMLVAGEGRACTDLMQAGEGRIAVKTGAEAVFAAILPDSGRAVALKIEDGSTRASNAAIAALLVRLGAVAPGDPRVARHMNCTLRNFAGEPVGHVSAADTLLA